jgi:hypothetical protein
MKDAVFTKYNLLLLMIPAIFTGFFPGKIIGVTMICFYPILFTIWYLYNRDPAKELISTRVIKFYIVVNIFIFISGVLTLSSEQDTTVMFGTMIFLTLMYPFYILIIRARMFIPILKGTLWIVLPLCFITFFFPPTNGFMSFQHNISFVYIFLLFIPYLKPKWKIILITLAITGLLYDLTRRSYMINLGFVLLMIVGYYLLPGKMVFQKSLKFFFFVFVVSPVILLLLGVSGEFNFFAIGDKLGEYVVGDQSKSRNILVDSRTAIYVDVFKELVEKDAVIWGLGGNGKTKTSLVDVANANFDVIYREGRRSTESGMLNYFQYGGIIAALSYWLLLTTAAYNAIFKSKSNFMRMLGMFVAFKVVYSFIEDKMNVNIASFYLMFMISLCYNTIFLSLKDSEVAFLLKKVFK